MVTRRNNKSVWKFLLKKKLYGNIYKEIQSLVEKNVKTKSGKENSYKNKFYINIKMCTKPLVIKKVYKKKLQ
jgi:hypothetical protein